MTTASVARVALLTVALCCSGGVTAFGAQEQLQRDVDARMGAPAPWREPRLLAHDTTGAGVIEVHLTAAPQRLSLLPGRPTDAFAYNGSVPGPTLEVYEGDSVVVHFRNELAEPTTVHWHGLHLPFTSDGSPLHPVGSGEEYTYAFRVQPGMAGTYWYHPHPHHRTGYQVAKGLYGAIIVRARDDPLPKSMAERLLILSDNRFRPDGAIDLPAPRSRQARVDELNGREGDVLFVNGQITPRLTIRSGEVQRWRIINASAARVYRLAIPGHTMLHVGNDGGLFEHPVETNEIVLANGERVELLVRGSAAPGTRTALQTLPYDRYMGRVRPDDWQRTLTLARLEYSAAPPVERVELPTRLRPIPALDTAEATVTRLLLMSQGRINSKRMQLDRVDERAKLGATEIWEVENLVGMDHPFHLHGFQFQVIDRNGVPEPFPSWKDTVNVPKRERVRFIVRFDRFAGRWMYHCHILDHEDAGMMGILEVEDDS